MNKYFPQKYVISYAISFIYGLITGKSVHLQSAPWIFPNILGNCQKNNKVQQIAAVASDIA